MLELVKRTLRGQSAVVCDLALPCEAIAVIYLSEVEFHTLCGEMVKHDVVFEENVLETEMEQFRHRKGRHRIRPVKTV